MPDRGDGTIGGGDAAGKRSVAAPRRDQHLWKVEDIPSKDWDDAMGSGKPASKAASPRREKDEQ